MTETNTFRVGDFVLVPDDGWGNRAELEVVGVHPGTVYTQRADGHVSAWNPERLEHPATREAVRVHHGDSPGPSGIEDDSVGRV